MWNAITQVTTGLTLVAFLAAIAVTPYRSQLAGRAKVIQSLPSADRVEALQRELNAFGIDAKSLTKEQQFQLALREIELRRTRLYSITIFIVVVALISGLLALISMISEPTKAERSIQDLDNSSNPAANVQSLDGPSNTSSDARAPDRAPDTSQRAPETIVPDKAGPSAPEPDNSAASPVTWEKNYDAVRRLGSGLGSSAANECGYRSWANRSAWTNVLKALDLTSAPELNTIRDKLLSEVDDMPANCGSDDHYNLAISPSMEDLKTALVGGIRAKVIENRGRLPD